MKKSKPEKEAVPDKADNRDTDKQDPEKVRNYARGKGSAGPTEEAEECYSEIKKAFENKEEQLANNKDYWNIYNAIPDDNQAYSGFTEVYDPIVRDCINSRTRRRLMQLFPANNVHVTCITPDNDPKAHMSLLEHYVRSTELREVVKQDLVAGDTTGQWCLYVEWERDEFSIRELIRKHPVDEDTGLEDTTEEYEDVVDGDVVHEGPVIEPFPVDDLAVIPPTVNRLASAKIVAIKLRASKESVKQMQKKGWLTEKDTDKLIKKWDNAKDPRKQRVEDAGVKVDGTDKYALIYMAWMRLTLDGKRAPAVVFFTGPNEIGGIVRNPNWSGRPNVFSCAVDKIGGSFYGRSKIEPVKQLQWLANDSLAMGSDSTKYSLLPIALTDPLKNPNYAMMTMGLAAVWPVDPNSTKFQTFPQLWQDATSFVSFLKAQIWESMDVNEMQFGKTAGGRKNNQQMAIASNEAQIPVMDDAKRYESQMLEPLCEFMLELDLINRHEETTVVIFGELGKRAAMEVIKPQRVSQRMFIQWQGTEYQASLQRIQQQIGLINVVRGLPKELLNGRRLDIGPALDKAFELLFGAQVAPFVLIDERDMFTIDPDEENEMLANGLQLEVHMADNDGEHLRAHGAAAKATGDPTHAYQAHMARHLLSLFKKAQAAGPMSKGPPGQQGVPGGAGPGVAGTPKQGALPSAPKGGQQPPGGIHQDQMADGQAVGRD